MKTEFYESPGKEDDGLTPGQRELAEYFLPRFEEKVIPEQERRDCDQEIIELQALFTAFEAKHPIAELYAITDINNAGSTIREAAKIDLEPIVDLLNIIEKETNITSERLAELQNRYIYLSQAVGIIHGDRVRH